MNEFVKTILVRGDPLKPSDHDLLVQITTLRVGLPVPEGWTVTDGNMHNSEIIRLGQRWQITGEMLPMDEDEG